MDNYRDLCASVFRRWPHWRTNPEGERQLRIELWRALRATGIDLDAISRVIQGEFARREPLVALEQ